MHKRTYKEEVEKLVVIDGLNNHVGLIAGHDSILNVKEDEDRDVQTTLPDNISHVAESATGMIEGILA